MQVPHRKSGKYTNLTPDAQMTKEKFNELKVRLDKLIKLRPGAAEEVRRTAAMGDLSENAAYTAAKGNLRNINDRISELADRLKKAVIIEPTKNTDTVQLGSKVTVKTGQMEKTYLILGASETNPDQGIISYRSPLGQALLGHKIGDQTELKIKHQEVRYEIVKIE